MCVSYIGERRDKRGDRGTELGSKRVVRRVVGRLSNVIVWVRNPFWPLGAEERVVVEEHNTRVAQSDESQSVC